MDSPSVEMPPGCAPVQVTAGTADLFALGDLEIRFPVATLRLGDFAFAADSPCTLLLVPRQGAKLVSGAPSDEHIDAALANFSTAVITTLGTVASSLAGASLQEIGPALGEAIGKALAADTARRDQGIKASIVNSAAMLDGSLSRMAYAGESLRYPEVPDSGSRLVNVLAIIGETDGFAVTSPTPEALSDTSDPLRLIAHTSGVRYRPITLSSNWQDLATSNFLSALVHPGGLPEPVALLKSSKGYLYQRSGDPAPLRLTGEVLGQLVPKAFEFYAPLTPDRVARVRDVIALGMHGTGVMWLFAATMALGVALLGLLTPTLTSLVVGSLVPQGEGRLLVQVGLALSVAALVAFVFSLVQNFTVSYISQRATKSMQSAFWDRVLSLPASFFRNYSSGDLAVRVLAVDTLQSLVSVQVVSAGLAAVFGLVNLFLMFKYDVLLGFVGLAFLILTLVVLLVGVKYVSKYATESLTATKQANAWLVQMLTGIMKIRISNSENRLESKYFDIARVQAVAQSQQTLVVGRISAWFVFAASGASALFYLAVLFQWQGSASAITSADYLAFSSAYGLAFAGIAGLSGLISPIANAGPTFNLLAPIMAALPETAGGRDDPGILTGHIDLRDIYFRYTEDGPMILKGLNLQVEPGKMLALVGSSGAGKSTITRQLLGFDTPNSGAVLYDGRDLRDLDPTMVRAQMGVVVQEGQVTRGTILKNILGSTSNDEAAAWAAAEKAALADDIRAMPMQMSTIVDPTNVSGGQAQRILLARAIVRNPSIIILDEATSALDNSSQAQITAALKELKATRIVIAHRLSTIMSADQIVVMEAGVAVEAGTYDELMGKNGAFTALVTRQLA